MKGTIKPNYLTIEQTPKLPTLLGFSENFCLLR